MRSLVVIAMLAGCYSPSYRDCEVTCASGSCPSGLTCLQGMCRVGGMTGACGVTDDARRPDGPANDVDADGVLNVDDNCPSDANPNQADEDGDLTGDVCDPCPISAEPADDADSDSDGVGDGCDPEAGQTNRIERFDGFADGAAPPTATVVGSWMFSGGQATMTLTPDMIGGLGWSHPNGGNSAMDQVSTKFLITAIAGGTIVGVGTVQFSDGAGGIACWLTSLPTASLAMFNTNATGLVNATAPFGAGQTAWIKQTRTDANYTCRDVVTNIEVANMYTAPAGSLIGIAASGVSATFDWIMVVSRAP